MFFSDPSRTVEATVITDTSRCLAGHPEKKLMVIGTLKSPFRSLINSQTSDRQTELGLRIGFDRKLGGRVHEFHGVLQSTWKVSEACSLDQA